MPKKYPSLLGKTYHNLKVTEVVKRARGNSPYLTTDWRCVCICGKSIVAARSALETGKTKSCGCLKGKLAGQWSKDNLTTHGLKNTPEWRAWLEMRRRCNSPESREANKNYVQRGIVVCDRWSTFENFLEDMGLRPSDKHSLDRRDNDKDYSKENCRWATKTEQNRNRRNTRKLTMNGVTKPITQWVEETGESYYKLSKLSRQQS